MKVIHSWSENGAVIYLEDIRRKLRVLHVTDSHIGLLDRRDIDHYDACLKERERFRSAGEPERFFSEIIQKAATLNVDLIALTGDILAFPSKANIDYVNSIINGIDIPILFAFGNHDWHFPDLPYSTETRKLWRPVLEPLNNNPAFSSVTLGGVRFIAIDNSDYQIMDEQLDFLSRNFEKEVTTVLLMHLPISIPSLRIPTIERWKIPILMGDPVHRNPLGKNVIPFVRLLSGTASLVAVLCGHIHFSHADPVNPWAMQYTCGPGFEGRYRLLEFLPMDRYSGST